MGIFDNIGKNVLGAVKTAATAATSYVEELEKQAEKREQEKERRKSYCETNGCTVSLRL